MHLLPIPPVHHLLSLKVTSSGITVLKSIGENDTAFRNRYIGSKRYAVNANGKEIVKKVLPKTEKPRKKPRPSVNYLPTDMSHKSTDNTSTFPHPETDLLTIQETLSTPEKVKDYRINKREVRQRLLTYINTQRGKKELYFWTVTFPAGTPDDKAYQAYNTWLTALRQYKMLKDYLWIAERQTGERLNDPTKKATNTIHFHIAIPHKMNVHRANAMMRGTLRTMAKKNEIPFSVFQCKKYNGVDIAKNRTTKRVVNFAIKKGARALSQYLVKYIAKNDAGFTHLAWHNSRGFSSLFTGMTFTLDEFKKLRYWARLPWDKTQFGWVYWHHHVDFKNPFPEIPDPEKDFFVFYHWKNDWEGPPAFFQHMCQLNSYIQQNLN